MLSKYFKRQGFFAVSITVLGLSTQPALSSPASDLIDKYNTWFLANGAETAAYSKAIEDGSKTKILDHKIEGMFSFSLHEDKPEISVYYIITTPKAVYEGSSRSGDTFNFESISTENMQLELGFFETSDAIKTITDAQTSDVVLRIKGDAKDYSIYGYSENWMDLPVITDGITAEELHQLLTAATRVSYDRSSIAEIISNTSMLESINGKYAFKNIIQSGVKGGVIEKSTIEELSYSTTASAKIDGNDISTTSETTYSDIEVLKEDIRPILALLGAGDAPSDLITSSYRIGSFTTTVKNGSAKAAKPFGLLEMSGGESATKEVRMSGGNAGKLFAAFAELKAKPSDNQAVESFYGLIDALGSFSVAYSDINDVVIKAWDPVRALIKDDKAPSFEITFKHFSTTDLTTNSLGLVKLEGLHGTIQGNDATFDLDSLELANIAWPSLRTMIESTKAAAQDPSAALTAIPTFERVSLSGLNMQTDDLDTPVSLQTLSIQMNNHIGPIPTSMSDVFTGLSFDAALLQEPMVLGVLERLGINRVTLNQNIKIAWDENTQDLTLEEFEFELENGMKLRADIQLGGIPRSLFENPHEAEAVIALATFKGAQIEVVDSPLISELLATQAEQAGLSAELLASRMIDEMLQEAGLLAETQFARELVKAAKSFAGNPTNIRVTLAPQTAVPILQLGGLATLAPQQLPEILGATVSYTH